MVGDSSSFQFASGGGGGGGNIIEALAGAGQKLSGYISGYQQLFGGHARGSGRMAERGARELAARMAQQEAAMARRQFEFQMRAAYPDSPVTGPQAVVTQYELPTKITTKQTKVAQKLMQPGLSPKQQLKLSAKQSKLTAKAGRYIAKHPESGHSYPISTRRF